MSVVKRKGFTLIELLVVISVISILSVILIRLLNIDWHRNVAEDSVRKARLEELVQGIEAFGVSEGFYPDPDDVDDMTDLTVYIEWPTDPVYIYDLNGTGTAYTISTDSIAHEGYDIIYDSTLGEIVICIDPDNMDTDDCIVE